MWWSVCENAAHGWTSQLPFSLEIIIILFLNLLSFLLSLISSMLFASNWMSSQYIQTCQNLCQLHVLEEITSSSFWPAWCPVWCWDLRSPSSGEFLYCSAVSCNVMSPMFSFPGSRFPLGRVSCLVLSRVKVHKRLFWDLDIGVFSYPYIKFIV